MRVPSAVRKASDANSDFRPYMEDGHQASESGSALRM